MKINLPQIDKEAMINACTRGVKDNCRKKRLLASKEHILKTSNIYCAALAKVGLSKINANQKFVGEATKDDMIYLYEERLVKSKQGKEFYNAIIAGAPWGKCPICGHYLADTVDHYLPKAIYYQFSVTLENLVPMCMKCNLCKRDDIPKIREKETIHPYFDDFDDEEWLFAKIEEEAGDPFGFLFSVESPSVWSEEKCCRARNHLSKYKLDDLYNKLSAADINKELKKLKQSYSINKDLSALKSSISDYLKVEREYNPNSWQTAVYRCLNTDLWFWNTFIPEFLDINK
ncbi:HNH endonuclease [Oribacterium sinus]|uniref:HNH endonuclease n=1 Tax=Oribacterium sinus TaxID=237576 RepID=UPI0006809FF1|nr:hypothetical protein [Oribacterium sinus]